MGKRSLSLPWGSGEAAATPPEGSEQHQWSVRLEYHAGSRAIRHSPPRDQ